MQNSLFVLLSSSSSSSFVPSRRIAMALLAAVSPSLARCAIAAGTLTITADDGGLSSFADFSDTAIIVLRRNGKKNSNKKLLKRRRILRSARREKSAVARPLAPEMRISGWDTVAAAATNTDDFIADCIDRLLGLSLVRLFFLLLNWGWLGVLALVPIQIIRSPLGIGENVLEEYARLERLGLGIGRIVDGGEGEDLIFSYYI